MRDATKILLKAAERFTIDEVLTASATMLAQAAMRLSGSKGEALAFYDQVAQGGRKSIEDNWQRCIPEADRPLDVMQ